MPGTPRLTVGVHIVPRHVRGVDERRLAEREPDTLSDLIALQRHVGIAVHRRVALESDECADWTLECDRRRRLAVREVEPRRVAAGRDSNDVAAVSEGACLLGSRAYGRPGRLSDSRRRTCARATRVGPGRIDPDVRW